MHCGEHKQELITRLQKIEGQVRGLRKKVNEEQYCVDILGQIAAIRLNISDVEMVILEDHTKNCVAKAIQDNNGEEAIDELMGVVSKFLK